MADDITYTSTTPAGVPNATKQATDEHVTRGHMPIVKLAYSADGDATPVTADANGVKVSLSNASLSVTQSGTWTVQPGNTANTTAWKVDGSAVTQPVSGTVTANDSQVVADNAGFTDGTTKVFMGGYIFDEVAGTALTENDAAAGRIDSKRAQVGIIEDGATRARYATVSAANALKVDGSGVTQPVSGTVTANPASGTITTVSTVTTVSAVTALGTITPGTAATSLGKAVDSALGSTDTGVAALVVRDDALATLTPADNDYTNLRANSRGALWVQEDVGAAATRSAFSSATDAEVIAANANRVGAMFENDSDKNFYLGMGTTATSTTSYSKLIRPGEFFSFDGFTGQVKGIMAAAVGSGAVRVTEVTK